MSQSWRRDTKCDCKTDGLWVRSPLEEMKYLLKFIFPFLRSGVEAKRDVESCHSTRNASKIRHKEVPSAYPAVYLFTNCLYLPAEQLRRVHPAVGDGVPGVPHGVAPRRGALARQHHHQRRLLQHRYIPHIYHFILKLFCLILSLLIYIDTYIKVSICIHY